MKRTASTVILAKASDQTAAPTIKVPQPSALVVQDGVARVVDKNGRDRIILPEEHLEHFLNDKRPLPQEERHLNRRQRRALKKLRR